MLVIQSFLDDDGDDGSAMNQVKVSGQVVACGAARSSSQLVAQQLEGKARQVDAKVVVVVCCCCCEAGESPVDRSISPRQVCVTIIRWPFLQNYTCILVVFLTFFWCCDVNGKINISVEPCVKTMASLFQHRAQNSTWKGPRSVGLDN